VIRNRIVPTDRDLACFGPRQSKVPGSIEWCYQTLDMLKSRWERRKMVSKQWLETLCEVTQHKVWERVPPDKPYGSLDALLRGELGDDIERDSVSKQQVSKPKAGLVGRFFHTFDPANKKNVVYQGHVLDKTSEGTYLVEYFSWPTGSPDGEAVVKAEDMVGWAFYPSDTAMNYDFKTLYQKATLS